MGNKFFSKKLLFLALSAAIVAVFGFADAARAGTLYLSPASGTFAEGQRFAVTIYTASADQAMNASQGVIGFSPDSLEVTSLNKGGSIMSFWIREPSFNNKTGRVNYEGAVFTPGYKGKAGRILTINFRVKGTKNGKVPFISGQLLANDGAGTNILEGTSGANFTLVAAKEVPKAPPGAPLAAPELFSPTHPEADVWYDNNDAAIFWTLPGGVTDLSTALDENEKTEPTAKLGKSDYKLYKDVADGVKYFHLRFNNKAGAGAVAHYKLQVDTTWPESLEVAELAPKGPYESVFRIEASDKPSGIDHYEIAIDNNFPILWSDDGGHQYVTPILEKGNHILKVKALDKAGNYLEKSMEFIVKGLSAPQITQYPLELKTGRALHLLGTSDKNVDIIVYVRSVLDEPVELRTQSNGSGEFSINYKGNLVEGDYKAWAVAIDTRQRASNPSNTVAIKVSPLTWQDMLREYLWPIVTISLPMFLLLLLLFLLGLYISRKLGLIAKHLAQRGSSITHEASEVLTPEEAAALMQKVSSLIVLPQDELPLIATINNLEKYRSLPFFAKAKVGDKILIYSNAKKAVLYDPEAHKVVDIAGIELG